LNQDIKNIFYLLQPKERKQMIDQIITKQLSIDVNLLWPHLSMAERKYLLGNLLSKDNDPDVSTLYDMMSTEEKMMVNAKGHVTITHMSKKRKGEKS
jgi:hypothetical protein